MNEPNVLRAGDLPPYVVRHVATDPSAEASHHHVTSVETDDPDGGRTTWSVVQVIAAIRDGERFTVPPEDDDGPGGALEPAICPACQLATLVETAPGT